ncbi:unnamed protein product [Calicophoron daubneyi]|uniref:Transmembrane protein 199 n=1 Tax=Calicophoron daubneyi TaxID=300641 RepID=A0AAV2U0A2_CALDB
MNQKTFAGVNLRPSDDLVHFFKICIELEHFPSKLKSEVEPFLKENRDIPFSLLYECHSWMKNQDFTITCDPLWRIFASTTVVLPEPEKPQRHPELDRRVKQLQEKFANRTYNKMIADVGPKLTVPLDKDDGVTICSELKCMNNQLIMVLNFILVVSAGFVFGFFIPEMISHSATVDMSTRLIYGFVVSFIVFFADLYFLVKNVNSIEKAR